MAAAGIIALFVAIGIGVIFVASSGGPAEARQAYLTGGRRAFKVVIPLLYVALGVAVPAVVIASNDESEGGTEQLAARDSSEHEEEGKDLFRQNCASCHSLAAVNARGNTGPSLDDVGRLTEERVLKAIEIGGTGKGRMPAGLLQGADAEKVAAYLVATAGK